jgi:hypothetical protein
MPFLNDERVDVYVSTWDRSIVKNERLNLDINDTITEDGVRNDLKIPGATILIEPEECFVSRRYNDKMIHRWLSGFEMIKNSGIEYNYVLVMRPDLFFNIENNISLDNICNVKAGEFHVGWFNGDKEYLQDNIFACTYADTEKLFSVLTGDTWTNQNVEGDWHRWWSMQIAQNFTEITRLGADAGFTFCRPIKPDCNFDDAVLVENIWTDATVLSQIAEFGEQFGINCWPDEVVRRAQARESSGYFNSLKAIPPKVAIVISGMLRNYDAALLSLHIWGAADRFLVTWESAGQEKIDDYIKKAGIKQSFAIKDSEFGNVYADGSAINNFCRMVYLWQQIFHNVPNDYDKYVIVRPDGFYWCTSKEDIKKCLISEMPFKTNQFRHSEIYGMGDHMFFINKSHISKFKTIFNDVTLELLKMHALNNHNANGHVVLYNAFRQNINEELFGTDNDMCSSELDRVIDTVFVRDTFNLLPSDRYDWKLYKAIYCDTASWWRNKHCHSYEGYLRPQLPDQK